MKTRVELKLFWKSGVLEIIWKFKFWNFFENCENDLKIGILKNYLKMEILKIKFENWNFGQLFENGSLKNWNFEELFENESFEN